MGVDLTDGVHLFHKQAQMVHAAVYVVITGAESTLQIIILNIQKVHLKIETLI